MAVYRGDPCVHRINSIPDSEIYYAPTYLLPSTGNKAIVLKLSNVWTEMYLILKCNT